jgi:hypothetical protein
MERSSIPVYLENLYEIHIPSMPPAVLASKEAYEITGAPNNVAAYAPAKEPIIIPIITLFFRVMASISVIINSIHKLIFNS